MPDNPRRPEQTQQQPVPATPDQQKPAEQPLRDTTHGHPGLPPKDYKPPRDK